VPTGADATQAIDVLTSSMQAQVDLNLGERADRSRVEDAQPGRGADDPWSDRERQPVRNADSGASSTAFCLVMPDTIVSYTFAIDRASG